MPIYTYQCPNCQTKIDAIRKMDQRDLAPLCTACYDEDRDRAFETQRIQTPVHGRVDQPADGKLAKHKGDNDQFLADMHGLDLKDVKENPGLQGLRNGGPGDLTHEFAKRKNPLGTGVGGLDATPQKRG